MSRPKPSGPRVRRGPDPSRVVVDNLDPYVGEVAGTPPADFNEMLEAAKKLGAACSELLGIDGTAEMSETACRTAFGRLRDTMLIAAYTYALGSYDGLNENPIAFVTRAKQVVNWCKRPMPELTPLAMIENKARALSHLIASRLFRGEGFVLLVFNEQEGGHVTWISSTDRKASLEMLRKSLDNIAETERMHNS